MRCWSPYAYLLPIIGWLLLCLPADAESRRLIEDAQAVARSELIVVGALVPASIERVAYPPGSYRTGAHRALLRVREVLKGDFEGRDIPIVVHGRLGLLIRTENQPLDPTHPSRHVEILESSVIRPVVADARDDGIWCLHRIPGYSDGPVMHDDLLGVTDPEDLLPLALKGYVLAYLSPDTEQTLRAQWLDEPLVSAPVRRYLDQLEIKRILEIEDLDARAQALLPYYLRGARWREAWIAQDALLSSGPAAGKALLAVFDLPQHENVRAMIIKLWGDLAYRGAVAPLCELLQKQNVYWAGQTQDKDWRSDMEDPNLRHQRKMYSEVHSAVYALGQIGDPRARAAIEQTLKQWRQLDDPSIVEYCEWALERFDAAGRS